jgi:peptidoglycan/LPS O-acetylase OafA/YrhL
MYFYLIFAISLLFGRARWMALAGWLVTTLLVVPYLIAPHHAVSIVPSVNYGFRPYLALVTDPLVLMFAAGAAIGTVYQSRIEIKNAFSVNLAVLIAVSLTVFQYVSNYRTDHGISEWGLSLIPLFLIVSFAIKSTDIRVPRALVYLGDISFSLYIFHPLVQEGFTLALLRSFSQRHYPSRRRRLPIATSNSGLRGSSGI